MLGQRSEYELTAAAEADVISIARYTFEAWGLEQARRYEEKLESHFRAIARKQVQPRVFLKRRPDLLFTRCEHHYVFYKLRDTGCPLILAVFHENMDLMKRVKERLGK